MSTALAKIQAVHDNGLTQEQVDLITRTVAKGATEDELRLFLYQCKRTGLDPLLKQIHAVKRWDASQQREVMSIQTGIDGYRLVASRTGKLAGIDDAVYDKEDGDHPGKASVTVYKLDESGQARPYTASARWSEYVQTKKDGTITSFWKRMPFGQLGKCAESLALRKAFPNDLSGVYTFEEMQQAEAPEPELVNNAAKAPHLKSHVEGQADEVVIGVIADMFSNDNGHFYIIGEKTCHTTNPVIAKKLSGAHGLKVELLTHEFTEEGKTFQKINNVIGVELDEAKSLPMTAGRSAMSQLESQLSASLQQVAAHEAGVPANGAEAAYNDETGRAAGVVAKVFPAVGKKPLGITLAGVNFSTFDKVQRKRLENSSGHYVVLTYVLKDGKYRNIVDVEKCGGIDYRNSLAGASEIPDDKELPF